MKRDIALVCTVWGERFTRFFTSYCLPSLLAARNLPGLVQKQSVTLLLYTDGPSWEIARQSPSFRRVAELIEIRPVYLDSLPKAALGGHWGQWQHATAAFQDDYAAFLLVIPDCIYCNDALERIAGALTRASTIYYSMPQVALELITPTLERAIDARGALDLTANEAAGLFVKYANPKHAVADIASPFFVTHPEYLLTARPNRLTLTEVACHPLAIRAGSMPRSYTFNPLAGGEAGEFLEILGVSCEPMLKFIEQYFRWPRLHGTLSRLMNLASWAHSFREAGSDAFARTQTVVTLHDGVAQQTRSDPPPRVRYFTATLSYLETVFGVHALVDEPKARVLRACVAAAANLPGFRARLSRLSAGATVLLPVRKSRFEEALRAIEQRRDAARLFREFVLMHVLPGRLRLAKHDHFLLEPSRHGGAAVLSVVHRALQRQFSERVSGRVATAAIHLGGPAIAYRARLDYGDLDVLLGQLERAATSTTRLTRAADSAAGAVMAH
jgi:hypothetical protein